MANLANINVTISAIDNTGPGVGSAMGNLSRLGGGIGSIGSIASGVFGGILGASVFRGITSGIGSIVSGALTLNSRMSQSQMAARSMVDAISEAGPTGASAFGKVSKAAEQFEKTMREIREREKAGNDDYATKIDDIKNKILDAEQEIARKKADIYEKEKRQIDDLNKSHLETIQDLNTRIESESYDFNERLYDMANSRQDKLDNLEESHVNTAQRINEQLIDAQEDLLTATTAFETQRAQAKIDSLTAELAQENAAYDAEKTKINERADHEIQVTTDKHNRELAALQLKITRENEEYDTRKSRLKKDAEDEITDAKRVSKEKIDSLNDQLAKEKIMHERFLRDIKEAYADANAKLDDGSGGGGGGGATMKRISFEFDFNKNLKNMGQDEINKFLDEVQQKYIQIGIKSPFNIADIQEFGKTMIRYTDGSAANMQKVLGIGQALAAFNPIQGIQGATFALNELFGAGNVRSLMTRFNLPPDAFQGLDKAKDAAEALDILTSSLNKLGVNEKLVEAYSNALVGAHQNVLETFNVIAAALMKPIYDVLTEGLINVNKFLAEHWTQITAISKVIAEFVQGAAKQMVDWVLELGTLFQIFWSEHGMQVQSWFDKFVKSISEFVIPILKILQTTWVTVQKVLEETIIPGLGRIFAKISELWIVIAPLLKQALDDVAKWWKEHHVAVEAMVKQTWALIEFVIKTSLDVITGFIKFHTALFKGDWEGAWNAIKETTSKIFDNIIKLGKDLWSSLKTSFKEGVNSIIDQINGFLDGLKQLTSLKINGKVVVQMLEVPKIPRLADGGIVTKPTIAMIGEAGAEAIVPLSKSSVMSKGMGTGISVVITGNNILDDQTAGLLADKVGDTILNRIALQGRYL